MKFSRRALLGGAAGLVGCEGGTMAGGRSAWHMWGSQVSLSVQPTAAATFQATGDQLFDVKYHRPETWSFFFGAYVGGASPTVGPVNIKVFVDLSFGVGLNRFSTEQRAQSVAAGSLPRFVHFEWDNPPGTNLNARPKKWTSVGSPVELVEFDATTVTRPEWIAAQNIQAQAHIVVVAGAAQPSPINASVFGWVAPRTHVRPEWFQERSEQRFLNGELNGQ